MIGPVLEIGVDRYAAPLITEPVSSLTQNPDSPDEAPRRLSESVLFEAARQLWTAVTLQHLFSPSRRVRVWAARIASEFREFVFPRPAQLECVVRGRVHEPSGDQIAVTVELMQGGRTAAVFDAELRVAPAAVVGRYEAILAAQAEQHIAAEGGFGTGIAMTQNSSTQSSSTQCP